MAPHPSSLPCTLAFPPPNHRDATTPSPCWGPHFMTQERIMFSNPTMSNPRLSHAATMSDDMLSVIVGVLVTWAIYTQGPGRLRNLCYDSWSLSHLGYLYPGTTPVIIKLDHQQELSLGINSPAD